MLNPAVPVERAFPATLADMREEDFELARVNAAIVDRLLPRLYHLLDVTLAGVADKRDVEEIRSLLPPWCYYSYNHGKGS